MQEEQALDLQQLSSEQADIPTEMTKKEVYRILSESITEHSESAVKQRLEENIKSTFNKLFEMDNSGQIPWRRVAGGPQSLDGLLGVMNMRDGVSIPLLLSNHIWMEGDIMWFLTLGTEDGCPQTTYPGDPRVNALVQKYKKEHIL